MEVRVKHNNDVKIRDNWSQSIASVCPASKVKPHRWKLVDYFSTNKEHKEITKFCKESESGDPLEEESKEDLAAQSKWFNC